MDIRKTMLIAHPVERVFDVIEAAEQYPAYLPGCADAVIVARDAAVVIADISVDYHGIQFGFRTRTEKCRPSWMAVHLVSGPFRHFYGEWELKALSADGCRVAFALSCEFDTAAMSTLIRPVFDRIGNALVDRFVARVDELCVDTPRVAVAATAATQSAIRPGTSRISSAQADFDHSLSGGGIEGIDRTVIE